MFVIAVMTSLISTLKSQKEFENLKKILIKKPIEKLTKLIVKITE